MITIPILVGHDSTAAPIGIVREIDGKLCVEFRADVRMTREMVFEIFGGAGLLVTETTIEDGVIIIRKGEILEFSLPPTSA